MRILFYAAVCVDIFICLFTVVSEATELANNTEHVSVQDFSSFKTSRVMYGSKTFKRNVHTKPFEKKTTYNNSLMTFKTTTKPMTQTVFDGKEKNYTRSMSIAPNMNASQDHVAMEKQTNGFEYNREKTTHISYGIYETSPQSNSVYNSTAVTISVTIPNDSTIASNTTEISVQPVDIQIDPKLGPKKACNIKQLNQSETTVCFSWYQKGGFEGFEISMNEDGNKISNPFVYKSIENNKPNIVDKTVKKIDKETENALNDVDCESDIEANVEGCLGDLKAGETMNLFLKTLFNEKVSPLEKIFLYTNPSKPENINFKNRTTNSLCIDWSQKGAYNNFSIKPIGDIDVLFDWQVLETNEDKNSSPRAESSDEINGEVTYSKVEGCIKGLVPAAKFEFWLRSHLNETIFSEANFIEYTRPFKPTDLYQINSTKGLVCMRWNQHKTYQGFNFQVLTENPKSEEKEVENYRNITKSNGIHQIEACIRDSNIVNDFNLSLTTFYVAESKKRIMSESTCFIGVTIPQVEVTTYRDGYDEEDVEISPDIFDKIEIDLIPNLKNKECLKNKCFLRNLEADTEYTFDIRAIKNGTKSTYCYSYDKVTSSSKKNKFLTVPGKVQEMKSQELDNGFVNITWKPPKEHKNIQFYSVDLNKTSQTKIECNKRTSNCSGTLSFVLTELAADDTYTVSVYAINARGKGRSEQLVIVGKKIVEGFAIWKVILPLVMVLTVTLIIVGLCVFRRSLHQSLMSKYAKSSPPTVTVLELEIQEPHPMKIEELMQELLNKHKDSDYTFSKEYELLNETSPKFPTTVALKPENKTKNRFNDILAFDHSRVKLSGGDMTDTGDVNDYINANFIPGYLSKRQYIASQGPMKGTVDDFWRMVWDHKVNCIVMLTKLFEKGKEKCCKYWSDDTKKEYGDITVELSNSQNYEFYEVRTFKVSIDSEKRTVTHFWFVTWPDFGVPCKKQLLKFLTEVRLSNNSNHPTIVHCSAGVGRTGTFILLDRIIHSINHDNYVDVFSVVKDMRQYRCRMVQTEAQYIFAHDCITEEILNSSSLLCYENGEPGKSNDTFLRENFYVNPSYKSLKVKN